jgi:hypothetical protein
MIQLDGIQVNPKTTIPRNRKGSLRSFAMGLAGCGVRSSVFGRGSGSKGGRLLKDAEWSQTSGGPAVGPSSPGAGLLWSTPGSSQPIGSMAAPSLWRLPYLGPSVSGTSMAAGWIHPCLWQGHHRVSGPDSRTTHSTGIASRRGADVQSVLQKAFGADQDPFVADRPKEAMDG